MNTNTFKVNSGQTLTHVHAPTQCGGRACLIHHPSDHHMRGWPMSWRWDRAMMERICEHGIGHPDPDQITFWAEKYGEKRAALYAVHGCDGCCDPSRSSVVAALKRILG